MSYSFLGSLNDWSVAAHVLDLPLWMRIGEAIDTAKATRASIASVELHTETDRLEAKRIAAYINETRRDSIHTMYDGTRLTLKLL